MTQNNKLTIYDQHIGNKIYGVRIAQGLTRQELSDLIGVTPQQLQKYEKGLNRISAGRLTLVAKALHKSISFFYEDMEEESPEVQKQQRICMEVSNNFKKIRNPIHQNAVYSLIRSLTKESYN